MDLFYETCPKKNILNQGRLGFYCLVMGLCIFQPSLSYALEEKKALSNAPWTFEFGPRYWLSTGTLKIYLYDNTDVLASRLTFKRWTGNATEGFWQLTHDSDVFLKGYFGGGSIEGGQFIDEDFPPGITPYSRTLSNQCCGSLNYVDVDLVLQDNRNPRKFVKQPMDYCFKPTISLKK